MSDTLITATRNKLFGGDTRQLVYKALDANAMRGRAIANNIANAETPGYKRVEVNFEEQVRAALNRHVEGQTTHENHIELGRKASIRRVEAYTFHPDFDETNPSELNNVDIDIENAKMAENQIQHNYNMQFASFGKIQAAIKGQVY
jgi:flagellar basal-body rod protein FlgB|uniref:Flagellar basal body rod protein FlgB n=1 Tax=uncultured bacterium contig00028 TaxID=1181517 RepID=A0A806KM28_9BACT|nr:flagellar basal-body rod protein FlgB [uncultured bacterium contig00028]